MKITNTYILDKPNRLIRLASIIFFIFTSVLIYLYFIYRPSQAINIQCSLSNLMQDMSEANCFTGKIYIREKGKWRIATDKTYELKVFLSDSSIIFGKGYLYKNQQKKISEETNKGIDIKLYFDKKVALLDREIKNTIIVMEKDNVSLFKNLIK